MRKIINRITKRTWILATLIGAVIAWTLGMLPSTIMSLTNQGESTPTAMSEFQVILLAGIMGIVLGLILAIPQWIILRKYLERANWWLGANSVAWAVGMPIVFFIAGSISEGAAKLQIITTLLLGLAINGAIVGAIHGWVLIYMVLKTQT